MAEEKEGQTEPEQAETNQAQVDRRGFLKKFGLFAGGVAAGILGVKLAESDKGRELTQKLDEDVKNLRENIGDKIEEILDANDIAGKMSEEPIRQLENRPKEETIKK